jgi:cell wall-associated NlpC family hydrolase
MATFSIREIYDAALAAGFTPEQATTWTAIALAESGGRTSALNSKGEHSMGLWQINVDPNVRANHWGNLNDPWVNARAAYEVSHHGRDMRPWTTTHAANKGGAHDYRTYLAEVEQVSGVHGDPRGVAGYGAPLPPPLLSQGPIGDAAGHAAPQAGPTAYDQIPTGAAPGAQKDSDHDGLVDEFERLLGSNPTLADSDHDGLVDGFEVAQAHSNPLSADTDHDTLSDSLEVALGTDPARLDTDADGITDAAEVRLGTDPLKPDAGTGEQPDLPSGAAQRAAFIEHPSLTALQALQGLPGGQASAMTTSAEPAGAPATSLAPPKPTTVAERFVDLALDQKGDRYIYGAEARLSDADPDAFDCSELTQWAAHRVGVTIPDGAEWQYLDLKAKHSLIPVDQALKTKGALLFYFSHEQTSSGARPARAHVAISLGDGRTIEARGRAYGVNEFAASHRFNYAGVIPGMSEVAPAPDPDPTPPPPPPQQHQAVQPLYDQIDHGLPVDQAKDFDSDGLTDAFEHLAGTSPTMVDTDHDGLSDTFEALTSHTDPLSADTDLDGVSDATEFAQGTDAGRIPGIAGVSGTGRFAENIRTAPPDTDHDGLSDLFEKRAGLSPTLADSDGDGLSDPMEFSLGLDGTKVDSDGDGLTDMIEVTLGSDPLQPGGPTTPDPGIAGLDPLHDAAGLDDLDHT